MFYFYAIGAYALIATLGFVFSGVLGGRGEKAGDIVLACTFWPLVLLAMFCDALNNVRIFIGDWAAKPKKVKAPEPPQTTEEERWAEEFAAEGIKVVTTPPYREMNCGACGHVVAKTDSQ